MHCSTTTNTTLANPKMHLLKPSTFTLNTLLLLLFLSSQKPLVDADIEQVTIHGQSSLSLNNNNSFASESDEEDIFKRSCSIEANITATNFTYLMEFGLQTYKDETGYRYVNATPDTGSDLTWFHSKPCKCILDDDCYSSLDIQKPNETIGCKERKCEDLKNIKIKYECDLQNDKNLCWYKGLKYADGTESKGYFGYSNFTFGKSDKTNSVNQRKLRVGFATTMKDEDVPERNGMVGLGLGELSFINQYGSISKKFSYYLPQFRRQDEQEVKDRSKFKFGCEVDISDKSTPLLPKQNKYQMCDTRYCIQLKSICLKFKGEDCGNHKIKVSEHDTDDDKVITIDSGSTFTYLKNNIFQQLLEKVKEKLDDKSPRTILDYKNCFEKKDGNIEKLEKLKLSFEFSGITIELKKENFFDEYSVPDCNGGEPKIYVCLTVEGQNEIKGITKGCVSMGIQRENHKYLEVGHKWILRLLLILERI